MADPDPDFHVDPPPPPRGTRGPPGQGVCLCKYLDKLAPWYIARQRIKGPCLGTRGPSGQGVCLCKPHPPCAVPSQGGT